MSAQRMSDKKLRRIVERTGVPFDRAWNRQGSEWEARVVRDGVCCHAHIRHSDYSVSWVEKPVHFDTCEGVTPSIFCPPLSITFSPR